jgi:hypothetical protein
MLAPNNTPIATSRRISRPRRPARRGLSSMPKRRKHANAKRKTDLNRARFRRDSMTDQAYHRRTMQQWPGCSQYRWRTAPERSVARNRGRSGPYGHSRDNAPRAPKRKGQGKPQAISPAANSSSPIPGASFDDTNYLPHPCHACLLKAYNDLLRL